jgi:PKD domain
MAAGLQSERSVCAKRPIRRPASTRTEMEGSSGRFYGRRGPWLLGGCVLVVLACGSASSASAATVLRVNAATGSDSGNCQVSSCKTIGYAVAQADLAAQPVTITAAAGIYNEDLTLSSAVSGLTIVGAGSGPDPATSTIIEGVTGANTIETADATSLTLEHLQVLNPEGDSEDAIEAPEADLVLNDVRVEQLSASGFADGINAGNGSASVTLNGGSVRIAGTESEGYAINNKGGPITVTEAAITVEGTGYALNAVNGVVSASHTQINMTDPEGSGYGINTYADIHTANTAITIAGSGLAVNDVDESTLENTTITLTNSEDKGYGVNSDGGITASNDTISVAGSDTGLNTGGNLTIANSTVTLSNAESTEAVFAAGAVKAAADHIINAGRGCGIFAGQAMTLNDTSVEMTNPSANVCGVFAGKDLEGERDEITIAGEGYGEGVGCGGALKLTDSTILLSGSMAEAWGIRASHSASLERVTVTSALGTALFVADGPSVVIDSTLINTGGEPTVSLGGEGTALIKRSTVAMHATGGNPAIAARGLSLIVENSLVLGGCGISFLATGGETYTLTVASSTIDAGKLGVRDKNATSITATVDENAASTALVNVEASILLEPPAAKIPSAAVATVTAPAVTVGPGGTGTVTIHCSYTEVPSVNQVQSGSLGTVDCPAGSDGNTFTEAVAGIFAHPGSNYVLNPAWNGVDSVPAGTVSLPDNLTPSSTDLAGDPRVLNGEGSCLPGLQDKGALELTGHEGIVPNPVIDGPESATADEAVTFTAAASSTPSATFAWQSSDSATGTGATFEHAFHEAGSYTLTVKASGAPGCIATATHTITIKPKPEPAAPPPPANQTASPQAPPASEPVTAPASPSASQFALICAKRRLALTDVIMQDGEVLLTGVAEGRFAGKVVEILFAGHQAVASARVQPDGFFSTRAPLPPVGLRFTNRARYVATVDGLRSLNLKLTRRLVLDPPIATSGHVQLSGEVVRPLTQPHALILVSQLGSNCTSGKVVARLRPAANGHYRVSIPMPSGTGGLVYRLSSQVRGSVRNPHVFRTYSLTESVQLH